MAITEVFNELLSELLELSQKLEITDVNLKDIAYETIAVEDIEIRKRTAKGEKVYYYTQLKAYRQDKTFTLKSWRTEIAPYRALSELVRLYRACRHLKKALEYL